MYDKIYPKGKNQQYGREGTGMFCNHCGKKLEEGTKICPYCGTPVFERMQTNVPGTMQGSSANRGTAGKSSSGKSIPGRSRKDMLLMILMLGVLLAALLVLLFIYFRSPTAQYQRNMNLGHRYLLSMQYEEAVKAYTEAIRIEPKKAEAYVGRGDAYVGLKQPDKATADYIKAIELKPELQDEIEQKVEEAYSSLSDSAQTETSAPTPTPTAAPDTDAQAADTYQAILQEYKKAQELSYRVEETDYPDVSYRVIQQSKDYDPEVLKYAFVDLNEDGFPELIIGDSYTNTATGGEENTLQDGYCCKDGQVQRISEEFISWRRDYAQLYTNHVIGVYHNNGTEKETDYYHVAADFSMTFLEAYDGDDINGRYQHRTSEGSTGDSISAEEEKAGIAAYSYQTGIPWHDFSELDAGNEPAASSAATPLVSGQETAVSYGSTTDTLTYTAVDQYEDAQSGMQMTVNGKETDINFGFLTYRAEAYAADINTADGSRNIIVNCPGDDATATTIVYAYQNSDIQEIGRIEGVLRPASITGNGSFEAVKIHTWGVRDYGYLCFICGETVEDQSMTQSSVKAAGIPATSDVTNLKDGFTAKALDSIPVYSDQTCTMQTGTIKPGAEFELMDFHYESSGTSAYQISESGTVGWVPDTYFRSYPRKYIENIMTAA